MSHYGSNFRNEEPIREKSRETVTNILLLDTTTLISILVMVVFIIKLFNKVIETNSVGTLPTSGRKKRNVFPSARKLVKYRSDFRRRRIFSPPPFSQHQGPPRTPVPISAASLEAQRLNHAVLSYDFIYLLIAIAATLLFVFETLYRVFDLYSTNNGGKRKKKRKKRDGDLVTIDDLDYIVTLMETFHESL